MFLYIIYIFGLLYRTNSYYYVKLGCYISPYSILPNLILGLLYKPIFFLFLVLSIRPISLHWAILVYQSIQILGLLYRASFLILAFFFLGYSSIRIIFLIHFFSWATKAYQYLISLFIFLG